MRVLDLAVQGHIRVLDLLLSAIEYCKLLQSKTNSNIVISYKVECVAFFKSLYSFVTLD